MFASGLGEQGSIPGRVIPKTQKMVLGATLLNTQHYKIQIKGKVKQSREWSSTLPYTLVVAIKKGAFGSPLTKVANFTRVNYFIRVKCNYTRMLCVFLNESWKQHPVKQLLDGHLPPISQNIKVRQARHHWTTKDELISNVLWIPTPGHTSVGWLTKTYIHQLYADIECSLENLTRVMTNRDGCQERIKRICAVSILW